MKKILLTAVAFLTLNAVSTTAQVTIGSTADPQPFSILELESGGMRGMRLPQMTTAQRKALSLESNAAANGLQIFNTTTRCVETWNGTKWIQVCPPEGPYVPHYKPTCETDQDCKNIIGFTAKALNGDQNLTCNSVSFTMKPVTGGVFYMGSSVSTSNEPNPSANRNDNEGPVQKVALSSFYMSETEVTQALFNAVMICGNIWSSNGTGDNYPAHIVSWYDAITFCNKLSLRASRTPCYSIPSIDALNLSGGGSDGNGWRDLEYSAIPTLLSSTEDKNKWDAATCNWSANGFRLPTEAEWEYAARGGQKNEYTRTLGSCSNCEQYIYSGSNDICDVAWYSGNNNTNTDCEPANNINGTKQVKGKKANDLGIYDMSGNVLEWCWNWWSNAYDDCCVTNPTYYGSGTGSARILRGGHWNFDAQYCRMSIRAAINPYYRSDTFGFRVVSGAL